MYSRNLFQIRKFCQLIISAICLRWNKISWIRQNCELIGQARKSFPCSLHQKYFDQHETYLLTDLSPSIVDLIQRSGDYVVKPH